MAKFDGIDPWKLLYRRVLKRDFQQEPLERDVWEPKPDAFIPQREGGLSVFVVDRTTPFRVLQHHLDTWSRKEQEDERNKEKARKIIERDRSVEHMVRHLGWRVIMLPLSIFPTKEFQTNISRISNDPFDRGHISIVGTQDAFRKAALRVCENENCRVLSIEECIDATLKPVRD